MLLRSAPGSYAPSPVSRTRRGPLRTRSVAFLALALAACGGAGTPKASEPFVIGGLPVEGPGGPGTPPVVVPPPAFPRSPIWVEDAATLGRTAAFGSFPSDMVRLGSTLFTTDADAVEGEGARILAFEAGGAEIVPSPRFATTHVRASDLVDASSMGGDVDHPPGFGFYLNDLAVPADDLGFVLANAGGSDSVPTLSNLVVFDPTSGTLRQLVNLATTVAGVGPILDSAGAPVPGDAFVQSGAEGVAYVPTGNGRGVLFVTMSNFVFGAPSFGATKYPGTVQVYDVDETAALPVVPRPAGGLATTTLLTHAYNPVAVTPIVASGGRVRVLVTEAGATGFDASFALVPVTPAAIEVYDLDGLVLRGRFDLGLAGLSGVRPALGHDAVGHLVAFFASSVLGEVYLLRLDGLTGVGVDPTQIAVLRGPGHGIPIDPAAAGSPGGNVTGLALSSDGRTVVVAGFGDYFAFPSPRPGRLYALSLPADVVGDAGFSSGFVAGTSNVLTTSGRTLGPLVVAAIRPGGPEVFVAVAGSLDPATFLGNGPASIGTLTTFGRIR